MDPGALVQLLDGVPPTTDTCPPEEMFQASGARRRRSGEKTLERGDRMVRRFDKVCLNRTIIDLNEVNGPLGDASAAAILQAWVDKLERTEDRCVEIKDHTPQIFNVWYVLSLCSLFSSSIAQPVLIYSGGVKGTR